MALGRLYPLSRRSVLSEVGCLCRFMDTARRRLIQLPPMQRSQDLGYAVGRVRRGGLAVFASGYAIVATGLFQHLRAAVVYLDGHLLAAPIGGFPEALEHNHMQSAVRARQPVEVCDNGVCVYMIGQPTLPLCSSQSIGPISYATTGARLSGGRRVYLAPCTCPISRLLSHLLYFFLYLLPGFLSFLF